jgi:hypothetical protein
MNEAPKAIARKQVIFFSERKYSEGAGDAAS